MHLYSCVQGLHKPQGKLRAALHLVVIGCQWDPANELTVNL